MTIAKLGLVLKELFLRAESGCGKWKNRRQKDISHNQKGTLLESYRTALSASTYMFFIPPNLTSAFGPPESNILESLQPFISQGRYESIYAFLMFKALLENWKRANMVGRSVLPHEHEQNIQKQRKRLTLFTHNPSLGFGA